MQKQLFVVTKNDKKINEEQIGAQSAWSLTNQPLSSQAPRDEISLS